jgi:peptidoglycan/LPS O-acetylase OafA/YrhL
MVFLSSRGGFVDKNVNLSIQGLRGFLASFVVLYHVYAGMADGGYFDGIDHMYHEGKMAVNLFFIISGYLIIQSLIKSGSIKRFFKNRILRIYPVFLVIHILIFSAGPIINYDFLADVSISEYLFHFLTNLLLLPGIFSLPAAQIVAWSLSYEMLFYVIAALLLLAKRSVGIFKNIKPFFFLTFLVCLVLFTKFPTMAFFLIGVLIFKFEDYSHRIVRKVPNYALNLISIISLVGAFVIYEYSLLATLLISYIFFFITVHQVGVVSSFLSTKVMVYLGNISYSLYLWHTFVMFPIKRVLFPHFENVLKDQLILITLFGISAVILSIIVSHFSYIFIEGKFVKWFKQYDKNKDKKLKFETQHSQIS